MSSPCPNSHAELSPAQASYVYWLSGLAPVATNIVTPLIVYWNMRRQPQPLLGKYNVQVNEVVRQFISGTIGLMSYFGGGELTRGLINGSLGVKQSSMDDSTKHVAMITGGVLASFIGFAFVRPYISTELICKFLKQEKGEEASFTDKEIADILHGARLSGHDHQGKPVLTDMVSHSKALALLEKQKAAKIAKVAGAKSNHWLIGPVQRWVDCHLVPNGVPDLLKMARYSTLALTGYLAALTVGLWGFNRLFCSVGIALSKQTQRPTAISHPALLAGGLSPGIPPMPVGFAMQSRRMGPRPLMYPMPVYPQRPVPTWGMNGLPQIR